MRRIVLMCGVILCVLAVPLAPLAAQVLPPKSNPAPQVLNQPFQPPKAAEPNRDSPPQRAPETRAPRVEFSRRGGDRPRADASGLIVIGVPGLPFLWPSGYTPVYSPYPYPNPYWPAPALTMPQPQVAAPEPPAPSDDPEPAPRKKQETTPEQKAKAGKFISFGDAKFAQQKYFDATDRYRTALQTAADLPEAHLRQGFAMVAMGKYETATKAFRRALAIRSDWSASALNLDQLYGDDQMAKASHLENLAKAVEANELDANLLVALGVELYFDSQRERAATFLSRAVQLGANRDHALDDLLGGKPAAAPAKELPGGKIVF